MSFLARLLAAALLLPPPYYSPGHEPESPAERAARIEVIVTAAMDEAAATEEWPGTHEELASAILAVTWYESRRWALEVHEGRVSGDRGSSICLAQIWSKNRALVGTSPEATRRCFRRAADILALHARRCGIRRIDREAMAHVLGAYGTGRTCHGMAWARQRAGLWASLMKAAAEKPDGMLAAHRDDADPEPGLYGVSRRARPIPRAAPAAAASP
jgi:hypothetical protein